MQYNMQLQHYKKGKFMNTLLDRALLLKDEIIDNRRALHGYAEIEFDIPQTKALVMSKLKEYGLDPQPVGKAGVVCTIGKEGGKTFLLRADMDALPIPEKTGLPFAAINGNSHSCGHDCHTSMLLGAAKLLKDMEDSLDGCVKLMFQPAEEILGGAKDMIENGVLESPKVDVAAAMHIMTGIDAAQSGCVYFKPSSLTVSADAIRVEVKGLEAHGSTPYLGVDAIQIAAEITIALQNIVTKELPAKEYGLVLVGKISGGTAVNIVADNAVLDITVRGSTNEIRSKLKQRVKEISEGIAKLYGGEAVVDFLYGMPPLVNDDVLCADLEKYCIDLLGAENVKPMPGFNGSEDFAMVAEAVPSVLFTFGVGSLEEGHEHYLHHACLKVNEDVLHIGSAVYAQCAAEWLKSHA